MEYDFIVEPQADPSDIRLQFKGAEDVRLADNGDLALVLPEGELRHTKPFSYRERDGKRTEVASAFRLTASGEVAFSLGEYDRSRPLVIDPTLQLGTYLGGSGNDAAYGVIATSSYIYVTGASGSSDFPAGDGTGYGTGTKGSQAFVARFNSTGTALGPVAFVGASFGVEEGRAITLDGSGNVYITGKATGFGMTLPSAYDSSQNGGEDAFVAKFSSGLNSYLYGTYLGGSNNDVGTGIAVGSSGNMHVCGNTTSTNFPLVNAADNTNDGSGIEGFVTKIASAGSSLTYSTYLGGGSSDALQGIAMDGSEACVTGHSLGTFPGAENSWGTGAQVAVVCRLTSAGAIDNCIYYRFGGNYNAQASFGIAVANSQIYITGYYASAILNPNEGAYVASFDGSVADWGDPMVQLPSNFDWEATVSSGSLREGRGIAVDAGNSLVFVGGKVGYQNGTPNDAFASKLTTAGGSINTHIFGGTSADEGNAVTHNGSQYPIVAGVTSSSNIPTSGSGYDQTSNGGTDAFVSGYSF